MAHQSRLDHVCVPAHGRLLPQRLARFYNQPADVDKVPFFELAGQQIKEVGPWLAAEVEGMAGRMATPVERSLLASAGDIDFRTTRVKLGVCWVAWGDCMC